MRMNIHDSLIHFPLAVAWMTTSYWISIFESGSWFLHILLPYWVPAALPCSLHPLSKIEATY